MRQLPGLARLQRHVPLLDWARHYTGLQFSSDLLAAVIVTVMLIPQSLAYALLAGLPPEVGLYASMLPLVLYAVFGSSRTLSVGPVAIISLMTASAIGKVTATGAMGAIEAAALLALISGVVLLAMGMLRLGFLASFLSHPVIAGFISASGILIALGQLGPVLGIDAHGETVYTLVRSLAADADAVNLYTLAVGVPVLLFLFWVRRGLARMLEALGVPPHPAMLISKAGPVVGVLVTSLAAAGFDLGERGVALVGTVPGGLPSLSLPSLDPTAWALLFESAVLIAIIGFVESVSVGKTLAAKRRQRISPDQELIGLGAANVASAVSGGYPVTGGFSRSVVNFDAGAQTQAAGILTALAIGLVTVALTPYLAYLPKATLAATIIVAVLSLVDLSILRTAWRFGRSDFIAVAGTLVITLVVGVEAGVACGVIASLALHLYKTSRPHIAVVGEVPGTGHYRNVDRHAVLTHAGILSVRIDESLYFANADFIEQRIDALLVEHPDVRHVVLLCSAINAIDLSALEALESINTRLDKRGVTLSLSELKGPVMDVLKRTRFLDHLSGSVFLSHHAAMQHLAAPTPPVDTTPED